MDYERDRLHIVEGQLRIANDLVEFKNECLQRLNKKLDRLEQENEELKRKAQEYYDLWQSELMKCDDYKEENIMNEEIKNVNNLEVGDFVSVFVRGSEISGYVSVLIIEKSEDKLLGLNHTGSTYDITQESEVTLTIPEHYVEDVYFNRLKQYFDSLRELKENS